MKTGQHLDSTPAKIPRRRKGVPKSRTGCSICRARHIKCDEAVPKCKNCVVAGWTCEYPTATTDTPSTSQRLVFINHYHRHQHVSHHVSIRAAPHDLPDSSPSERRALTYFQHRAASELGGVCLPDLWSKYILSTSRSSDVIRHAVVALVVFHEDDVLEPFGASSRSKYALQHYSKGVNGLLQLKHDPESTAVDITLMCCIIFGTIELLRGNFQSALVHLHSGKSILFEEGTRLETDAASHLPRRLVDDILQRVESQILGLMDVGTFDLPLAVRPAKPAVPDVFESVQDAFYLLETLHNQILHFFSHVGRFLAQQNDHPIAFEHLSHELREFETLFHNWETSFDHFTRRRESNNDDPVNPLAVLLLNILRTGVKTTFPVHRGCHMRQSDFDAYTPDFANIVAWCETYINSTSTRRPPGPDFDAHLGAQPSPLGPRPIAPKPGTPFYTSTFTMSTGIVSTLFLCGVRCRDPVIRRKASDLLQYGIRKEGLWHSRLCSTIVDVCIRCEEDNALREIALGEMGGCGGVGKEVGNGMGTEVGTEVGAGVEKDVGSEVRVGAGVRVGSSVRALVADGVITDASQISENARVVVDGFRLVGERRGEVSIRANVPDENGKEGLRSVVMVDQVWW